MEPGALIASKYRLDRCLGQGGMGEVWAATHEVTKKTLALKFVKKKADDEGAQRRALREARAACAVAHPNVVAVHDVLESDEGMPILVMDLLHGESLAQRIERERTLSPADTVRVAKEVLSALVVAHGVGVVHRDLKPDNVFLEATGGVKILDFGIAKLRGNEGPTKETHRLTESGAMVGTPHYMSPEQAFGETEVDLRADLFSVGAVMYECLSGSLPTDGHNLGQILKALATGKIKPLRGLVPDLDAPLSELVDKLLSVDPNDRPESAQAVLDGLSKLYGLTTEAHAPVEARAVSASLKQGTPPPATRDTREEPKKRTPIWIFGVVAALAAVAVGVGVKSTTTTTATPTTATTTTTASTTTTATTTATATATTIATATVTTMATATASQGPTVGSASTKAARPFASAAVAPSVSASATAPRLLANPPY